VRLLEESDMIPTNSNSEDKLKLKLKPPPIGEYKVCDRPVRRPGTKYVPYCRFTDKIPAAKHDQMIRIFGPP
jgi:hypothetical protein